MRRRCLGCGRLIVTDSRCRACKERHRSSYSRTVLAEAVKRRDNYTCRDCGVFGVTVEAHHTIPLAEGGLDTAENMLTLCVGCHDKRHGKKPRHA